MSDTTRDKASQTQTAVDEVTAVVLPEPAQANAIVGLQPIWLEKAAALPEDSAPSASESAARAVAMAMACSA